MYIVFSATDEPPNDAPPKRLSPRVVPGANKATPVTLRGTGIRANSTALIFSADSEE